MKSSHAFAVRLNRITQQIQCDVRVSNERRCILYKVLLLLTQFNLACAEARAHASEHKSTIEFQQDNKHHK